MVLGWLRLKARAPNGTTGAQGDPRRWSFDHVWACQATQSLKWYGSEWRPLFQEGSSLPADHAVTMPSTSMRCVSQRYSMGGATLGCFAGKMAP